MKNQIFKSKEFGQIRTCTVKGETYFVGKDVASALGYKKPENAIAVHVDKEDKTSTLIQGSGSNYKCQSVFINENSQLKEKVPQSKQTLWNFLHSTVS